MITKKICPRCGSEDVHPITGTGQWMCYECRYSSAEFVEEPIIGKGTLLDEDEVSEEDFEEEKPKKVVKKKAPAKKKVTKKKGSKK